MLKLSLKLRRLKRVLRGINDWCFSNISGRVFEARQHLKHLQALCGQNLGDESLRLQESEALRQFMELSNAEESFKK
ncbi:hypothetical protein RHMOL_Rhmol06G0132000 [Rhododendron molle]|uniref:Uncharacterized protein n=1 Tax=Rhododendron molle TaxID=49168 RepID=A0ACC0NCW7_RHOML|nr:hypothetical protein RHMOL_Rhmol06G0132000 [Rhododendron molle]